MILTETNITYAVYCKNRLGHGIVCLRAVLTTSGSTNKGVGLVMRERPKVWDIDATKLHEPNVVNCEIVYGFQQTPLIGAYISLSTLYHLSNLGEALNRFLGS